MTLRFSMFNYLLVLPYPHLFQEISRTQRTQPSTGMEGYLDQLKTDRISNRHEYADKKGIENTKQRIFEDHFRTRYSPMVARCPAG